MNDDRAMKIAREVYDAGVSPYDMSTAALAVYASSLPAIERQAKAGEMYLWIDLLFKPAPVELAN